MYPLPHAVIFDLDGTLLNTIEDIATSCNHVLSTLNHQVHPVNDYFYFVGNGISTLAQRILPTHSRSSEQIQECVTLISDHYDGDWKSQTTIYSGIRELLTSLQDKNIPINILSNKNESVVRTMVQHFFADFTFQYILGTVDHAEKKPHPGRALFLAEKLQLSPVAIMFIGDSKVDMQTAQNAGMISVGVTWGFRTKQELQDYNAKVIIDSPMDFWDFINL